jgi:hypothetical protein
MIAKNKYLYIFTKDWSTRKTTVYKIPKKRGNYIVNPKNTFEVSGLITAADISHDGKKIALLGYRNYQPFCWIFTNFTNDEFFDGEKRYIELEGIFDAQTEGLCFIDNFLLAVSCEQTSSFKQQVFTFNLNPQH